MEKKLNLTADEYGVTVNFGKVSIAALRLAWNKEATGFDSIEWKEPTTAKVAIAMSPVPEEEIYAEVRAALAERDVKLEEIKRKAKITKQLDALEKAIVDSSNFQKAVAAELPGAEFVSIDWDALKKHVEEHAYFNEPCEKLVYNGRGYTIHNRGSGGFYVSVDGGSYKDDKMPKSIKGIAKAIKDLSSLMDDRAEYAKAAATKVKSEADMLANLLGQPINVVSETKWSSGGYRSRGHSYEAKHYETAAGTKIESVTDKTAFIQTAKSGMSEDMYRLMSKLPRGIRVQITFPEAIPVECLQQTVKAIES